MRPFHMAFPIRDIAETELFYTEVLACKVGRRAERWIDFDFYGHQLSAHLAPLEPEAATNAVDAHQVPVRHFGVVLDWQEWHELAERLRARQTEFIIEPAIRFQGQVGEQATMFFKDPNGHALEFKSFKDSRQLFATD